MEESQETRYVTSGRLVVEEQRAAGTVMVHQLLGTRLLLNKKTVDLLDRLKTPASISELKLLGNIEVLMPTFKKLLDAGFLHPDEHEQNISDKVVQRVPVGFFGCPSVISAPPEPLVTFLGVPYDLGNHRGPGARNGPSSLRAASLSHYRHYHLDPKNGQPAGFFDNEIESMLMQGIQMADAGDIFVAPAQAPESIFKNIRRVVSRIVDDGSFPVVVGGDHSITYSILEKIRRKFAIIHIDAHADLAEYHQTMEHHHGNFMTRALGLKNLECVYQIGVRGITRRSQIGTSGKIAGVYTVREMREIGIPALIEKLPADIEYYMTFDIDSIDPAVAPGTTTPVPGGFDFHEAKDLVRLLGQRLAFTGFDLVEVNPTRDNSGVTELVALEVMLAFLGGNFSRSSRSD